MDNWKELISRLGEHRVGCQEVAEIIYEYMVRGLEEDPEHEYAESDTEIIGSIKSFVFRGEWD